MSKHSDEIRNKYIENPPEGMTADDIRRMSEDDLLDMDYLVVTGGTGEAWWHMIKDEFKGLKSLTVLSGNENSDLPFTFSNVRGYYFYLYRTVKKKK